MDTPRNKINRTFSYVPDALEFIDGYSETFGLSKSSTVNQAVLMMKAMIEKSMLENMKDGISLGTAIAMQAETTNP